MVYFYKNTYIKRDFYLQKLYTFAYATVVYILVSTMTAIFQTSKRFFCTLLAVLASLIMFSNNSESFSTENNCIYIAEATVITGIKNIHITPSATLAVGTIYVTDAAVFYSETSIAGSVVYFSTAIETASRNSKSHLKPQVAQIIKKRPTTVVRQIENNPFSSSNRNLLVFATDATLLLPFSRNNSKKNTTIYPIVCLNTTLNATLLVVVATLNNVVYNGCFLRHSSHAKHSLFTRPPPFKENT